MSSTITVLSWVLAVLFQGQTVAQREGSEQAWAEAQYHLGRKDCPRAVVDLRAVLASAPERADVHRLAGDCFLTMGQPLDALSHYREWARLEAGSPDAAAAVARAEGLQRQIETRREERERTRLTVKREARKPSLGELARARGRDRSKTTAPLYTLVEGGQIESTEPSAPREARAFMLDEMRARAEAVLRPAMTAAAAEARQLAVARRRYADACEGKTTSSTTDGVREGRASGVTRRMDFAGGESGRTWSEWAWVERWRAQETRRNEESVECRALSSDVDRLSDAIAGVLGGCEAELARSPAVYRGVREDVFARLAAELW